MGVYSSRLVVSPSIDSLLPAKDSLNPYAQLPDQLEYIPYSSLSFGQQLFSVQSEETIAMKCPQVARDIMVTNLVTLDPQMDIFHAIDLLLRHKISGAPVVEQDGSFMGVFTEKDCLSLLVNAAYEQIPTTQIRAFVETDVRTVSEETDLWTIAQIFLRNPFRRLPVLRGQKVVGQISRRDLLRAVNSIDSPTSEPKARLLYLSSLVPIEDAPI